VEVGQPELDQETFTQVEMMVSMCASLVTIDEESYIIRLVHYTMQDYFRRTQKRWFPKAETEITNICITYLSFDTFEGGFCSTYEDYQE
jgi:hypothetical protein